MTKLTVKVLYWLTLCPVILLATVNYYWSYWEKLVYWYWRLGQWCYWPWCHSLQLKYLDSQLLLTPPDNDPVNCWPGNCVVLPVLMWLANYSPVILVCGDNDGIVKTWPTLVVTLFQLMTYIYSFTIVTRCYICSVLVLPVDIIVLIIMTHYWSDCNWWLLLLLIAVLLLMPLLLPIAVVIMIWMTVIYCWVTLHVVTPHDYTITHTLYSPVRTFVVTMIHLVMLFITANSLFNYKDNTNIEEGKLLTSYWRTTLAVVTLPRWPFCNGWRWQPLTGIIIDPVGSVL